MKIIYILKSVLRNLIKVFFPLLPVNKTKIVFDNFGGRGYGDNPKYIANEILSKEKDYDLVWLLNDIDEEVPQGIRKVKYGSLRAYYEWSTAGVWVDNIRNSMRPQKKKVQLYLQTWHGSLGVKNVEAEASNLSESYIKSAKYDGRICDGIISMCDEQSKQFRESFWLNLNTKILEIGLPKNDRIFSERNKIDIAKYRQKLGILKDDLVILYMPTFRDDKDEKGYLFSYESIINTFEEKTNKRTCVIVRFHPNSTYLYEKVEYNDRVINGTFITDNVLLYLISDYMITDYSGACYDFALLEKPVFLFASDYESYSNTRGIRSNYLTMPFDISYSEKGMLENIRKFNYEEYLKKYRKWFDDNKIFDNGTASFNAVKWIEDNINYRKRL